jgi:TonB family protein
LVILEVEVSTSGRVECPCVVKSVDPSLDAEAVKTVKKWRFKPAKIGSSPARAVTTIVVDFPKSRR